MEPGKLGSRDRLRHIYHCYTPFVTLAVGLSVLPEMLLLCGDYSVPAILANLFRDHFYRYCCISFPL
jgi:hypothetical protein